MAMPQEPVLVVVDAPALLVPRTGPAEVDVGADRHADLEHLVVRTVAQAAPQELVVLALTDKCGVLRRAI